MPDINVGALSTILRQMTASPLSPKAMLRIDNLTPQDRGIYILTLLGGRAKPIF